MKLLRFKEIFEDAMGDAGSSTGMGMVVAAQAGEMPGTFGTDGSGDIGRPFGVYTKSPVLNMYSIPKKKKKKKKVKKYSEFSKK